MHWLLGGEHKKAAGIAGGRDEKVRREDTTGHATSR